MHLQLHTDSERKNFNMTSKSKVNIFYDLESSGLGKQLPNSRFNNYAWEQIYQFGYIVMDEDFDEIIEDGSMSARPLSTVLPHPQALLTTRKTMNELAQNEMTHHELIMAIHNKINEWNDKYEVAWGGHNILGYDEHLLSENFFKNLVFPFSTRTFDRFDTIKLIPFFDKIKPVLNKAISKTGKLTYSLEALAHANNVGSAAAHDATEDVIMTASLVKILKKEDNNLFSDIFKLKDKNFVLDKMIKNKIFLVKLAAHAKHFRVMTLVGQDDNNLQYAYCLDVGEMLNNSNTSQDQPNKYIKKIKLNNFPLLMDWDETLLDATQHQSKEILKTIADQYYLNSLLLEDAKLDFEVKEFDHKMDEMNNEIIQPEEMIHSPRSSQIEKVTYQKYNQDELKKITEQSNIDLLSYFAKRILFEENPFALTQEDREFIYSKNRERLFTEGNTYFHNIAEARDNLDSVKKDYLKHTEQENKILDSYDEYLDAVVAYYKNESFNHDRRFEFK